MVGPLGCFAWDTLTSLFSDEFQYSCGERSPRPPKGTCLESHGAAMLPGAGGGGVGQGTHSGLAESMENTKPYFVVTVDELDSEEEL